MTMVAPKDSGRFCGPLIGERIERVSTGALCRRW